MVSFRASLLHKINLMLWLQVSKDLIHQRTRNSLYLILKKMTKKPALIERHKIKRLEWAKKLASFGGKWLSITFFWREKVKFKWIRWVDLLLVWFGKRAKNIFQQTARRKICDSVWGAFGGFNNQTT